MKDKDLGDKLAAWQFEYNWYRPHGALNGKTPMDKYHNLIDNVPFTEEVEAQYPLENERLQLSNYSQDLKLKNCKGSI